MPIEKGGREPKLTSGAELAARFIANRHGGAALSPRSRVRGKTSISLEVAQLLAQRADDRVRLVDVDPSPLPLIGTLPHVLPPYTPTLLDCPPSSPYPAGGPVWQEALRVLGLPESEDRTR